MDQRDSYCPYLPLGELTVEGTGSTKNMGKEDPCLFKGVENESLGKKDLLVERIIWVFYSNIGLDKRFV